MQHQLTSLNYRSICITTKLKKMHILVDHFTSSSRTGVTSSSIIVISHLKYTLRTMERTILRNIAMEKRDKDCDSDTFLY